MISESDIAVLEAQRDATGQPWEVTALTERSELVVRTTGPWSSLEDAGADRPATTSLSTLHRIGFRMDFVEVPRSGR